MAEANSASVGSGCEEKGPDGSPAESVPHSTTISRLKLLDTTVDTFLQKLIAAGSYQRFTDCYKCFYQLQPEMTQRIYDKFMTQLQTSVREEISDIKAEGNLEAVLNALDTIAEEGKDRKELACSGMPCSAVCGNRRLRTGNWQAPSWPGAGRWRSCSCRARPSGRPGRLSTEDRKNWWLC
ncbi:polyamine-modulated factor 1 isoform X2 [Artibeus jamaicensis]|uniref:polyamine-modulated factor 1 isoform X2 n=1 Tax=Artibeus jamaicensis TaxID=9417 RepID=UPI00235B19FD|nr:polyamine-modulated factor 1 isoform X2 [Artibeus jamaicensis]